MARCFAPKLPRLIRRYSKANFFSDLWAGLSTGVVALPLSLAIAIAAGLTPAAGLYTSIVAGVVVALFTGVGQGVAGPAAAFTVLIANIIIKHGVAGLALAALMSGFVLVLLGLLRAGRVVRKVPEPVIYGFTAGVAVIIATSQVGDFLGLRLHTPPEFIPKWHAYLTALPLTSGPTLALGCMALLVIHGIRRVSPHLPSFLVALGFASLFAIFMTVPVETLGSRFGGIPSTLPTFQLPHLEAGMLLTLLPSALSLAFLGAIESLLSARAADKISHTRHNADTELIAQGLGNIASPLFGGMPATGVIARTASNIHAGARTPLSALIHSVTVLMVLLVFGRWAAYIPMTSLAAVLLAVAARMSHGKEAVRLLAHGPYADRAAFLSTFIMTIFVDLMWGIVTGVVVYVLIGRLLGKTARQMGVQP